MLCGVKTFLYLWLERVSMGCEKFFGVEVGLNCLRFGFCFGFCMVGWFLFVCAFYVGLRGVSCW